MVENKTTGFIGGKFLPLHQGHIYAIMKASNMVDKLYVVLTSSEKRDRKICKKDNIKYMPAEVRLSWLGKTVSDLENIEIIHIKDDKGVEDYDWAEGAREIKNKIGKHIDYIFSSEKEYGNTFKKLYPNSTHIVIDNKREEVNISATKIRKNLYSNWDNLPSHVKSYFVKKIAIVGTESCGKSTFTKKLAKSFNTNYVKETGRKKCEEFSNFLTKEMFDEIAIEHYLLQKKESEKSNKLLFVDTEAIITQYYLDMYFNESSDLINEVIKKQDYDLVIFLEPDVKWVDDGLRFKGNKKERLNYNEKLKKMFEKRGIETVSVSGNYDERFNKSRKMINSFFDEREESK